MLAPPLYVLPHQNNLGYSQLCDVKRIISFLRLLYILFLCYIVLRLTFFCIVPFLRFMGYTQSIIGMTNNYLTAKSKQFCVLYLNIRSLKKNLDDLSVFLVQNKLSPDLIALSETWLGKNSFFQPKINGYNYVSGKLTQRAGAVGLFYFL